MSLNLISARQIGKGRTATANVCVCARAAIMIL